MLLNLQVALSVFTSLDLSLAFTAADKLLELFSPPVTDTLLVSFHFSAHVPLATAPPPLPTI